MRALPALLSVLRHAPGSFSDLTRFGSNVDAHFPDHPVWYLQVIGVGPAAQGLGVGSRLLEPALELPDRQQVPSYLETSNPGAVRFYRRAGFEIGEEGVPLMAGRPHLLADEPATVVAWAPEPRSTPIATRSVLELVELGFPWHGLDPFIFTVHHLDAYPAGNDDLGPAASLSGRRIGTDFSYVDGWSMYHGDVVPGFPQHPHRGFETVTVVRRGYVDHSDSLGATARYGQGDVQWLTTGNGIMHAEMFPLLDPVGPNPMELFQIWLNLPPESKLVPAYFGMLWGEDIPTIQPAPGVEVDVIAGVVGGHRPPSPPPDSWASRADSHLAIWLIRLDSDSGWQLPLAPSGTNRMLHCFQGNDLRIGENRFGADIGARLRPDAATVVENHGEPAELLLLQGRPIGAPVFQMGPFVMNSAEELRQAVDDYHRTQFGGWPWSRRDPVHDRSEGRFAIHADGEVEHRDMIPTA